MSFGFADLPLLAMSSKFSGYEDVKFGDTVGTVCELLDFDAPKMENIAKWKRA